MITRRQANAVLLATAAAAASTLAAAEQAKAITLPSPRRDGGEPLLMALNLRRSEFKPQSFRLHDYAAYYRRVRMVSTPYSES